MIWNTSTEELEDLDVLLATDTGAAIIMYNDDVNTFDHVINCLIKYCKHEAEQAEQCAMIIHYKGKCAVKTGSFADLQPVCNALTNKGLSAIVEQL